MTNSTYVGGLLRQTMLKKHYVHCGEDFVFIIEVQA